MGTENLSGVMVLFWISWKLSNWKMLMRAMDVWQIND